MRGSLIYPIAVLLVAGVRPLFASFNFAAFPSCSRNILYETAPENCSSDDLIVQNKCLCSDKTWLKDIADKIQGSCSCTELDTTAEVMIFACSTSGTQSALSADEIIAAGGCSSGVGGSSSAAPVPSNTASHSGPSSVSNDGNAAPANTKTTSGGSSNDSPTSDRIALGVGIGIGVPTILLAAVGVWLQCIRRR